MVIPDVILQARASKCGPVGALNTLIISTQFHFVGNTALTSLTNTHQYHLKTLSLPIWPISKQFGLGCMLLPPWKLLLLYFIYLDILRFFQSLSHQTIAFIICELVNQYGRHKLLQYRISARNASQTQLSRNLVCPIHIAQLSNLYDFCTDLANITAVFFAKFQSYRQLGFYGRTRFCELSVWGAFLTDIPSCNSPWISYNAK